MTKLVANVNELNVANSFQFTCVFVSFDGCSRLSDFGWLCVCPPFALMRSKHVFCERVYLGNKAAEHQSITVLCQGL